MGGGLGDRVTPLGHLQVDIRPLGSAQLPTIIGARGGIRTHTGVRPQDFKSCASASSATRACQPARFYRGSLQKRNRVRIFHHVAECRTKSTILGQCRGFSSKSPLPGTDCAGRAPGEKCGLMAGCSLYPQPLAGGAANSFFHRPAGRGSGSLRTSFSRRGYHSFTKRVFHCCKYCWFFSSSG